MMAQLIFNIFSILYFLSLCLNYNTNIVNEYFRYFLLINYLVVQIYSFRKFKVIFLVNLSIFIFLWGRVVLTPFFYEKDIVVDFFLFKIISPKELKLIYILLYLNLIGIFYGGLIAKKIPKFKEKNKKNEIEFQRYVFYIICTSFIIYIGTKIDVTLKLRDIGYVELYRKAHDVKPNILFRLISLIPFYGITIFLALKIKSKKFLKIGGFIFIIKGLFMSLIGSRSYFIMNLFFIYLYYTEINFFKIRKKIILCLLIFSIGFINYLELSRKKEHSEENKSMISKIENFIYNQGVTGTFISFLESEKKLLFDNKNYSYIFSPILGERSTFQDEETIKKIDEGKNLPISIKMSAKLNEEEFLKGYGMGGNYILEMYDLGRESGVFLWSILQGFFLVVIVKNFYAFNLYFRALLIYIFPNFFFVPRANYFYILPLKEWAVFTVVFIFLRITYLITKTIR